MIVVTVKDALYLLQLSLWDTNFFFLNILVPNEEPKSPVFKTFPQSATVQEGESVKFECEFEKVPQKGEF
jgi:hypothetical protein